MGACGDPSAALTPLVSGALLASSPELQASSKMLTGPPNQRIIGIEAITEQKVFQPPTAAGARFHGEGPGCVVPLCADWPRLPRQTCQVSNAGYERSQALGSRWRRRASHVLTSYPHSDAPPPTAARMPSQNAACSWLLSLPSAPVSRMLKTACLARSKSLCRYDLCHYDRMVESFHGWTRNAASARSGAGRTSR